MKCVTLHYDFQTSQSNETNAKFICCQKEGKENKINSNCVCYCKVIKKRKKIV